MRKYHCILTFIIVCIAQVIHAQPPKTTVFGKEVYVYPLRSNSHSIPAYFGNLPDGDYVMYSPYEFKKKILSKKNKLADTTEVKALFTIKNNLANGHAAFYYKNEIISEGKLINGLREGIWHQKDDYSPFFLSDCNITVTYKNNERNGPYRAYRDSTLIVSGQYKNNSEAGTWKTFSSLKKVTREYTVADSISHQTTVYDLMYQSGIPTRHGIDFCYMANGKKQTIAHAYGHIIYFDTLYYNDGNISWILKKEEPSLPDSVALFSFTKFDAKKRICERNEYKNGNLIRTIFYTGGIESQVEYFAGYYKNCKPGDLLLIQAYLQSGISIYEVHRFPCHLTRTISRNGDTTERFKILNLDTTKGILTWQTESKSANGVSFIHYNSVTQDSERYDYWHDSTMLIVNQRPFTGVYQLGRKFSSKYHVKKRRGNVIVKGKNSNSFSVTEYKNGKPHGKEFTRYRFDGCIKETTGFNLNGKAHGTFTSIVKNYKLNGFEKPAAIKNGITKKKVNYISQIENYEEGKYHGIQQSWHPTGHIMYLNYFLNGKRNGYSISINNKGDTTSFDHYKNGKKNGLCRSWYENGDYVGVEATYTNDVLNGWYKRYNNAGQPRFSIYATNGIINGETHFFNYRTNKLEWQLKVDIQDSVPYKYTYVINRYNGYQRDFDWDTEDLITEIQLCPEALPFSFHYTEYYSNGQIAAVGKFKKGRMDSTWLYYNTEGTLIHEILFKNQYAVFDTDTVSVIGTITSWYSNGGKRSTGYLTTLSRSFDCINKKNVYSLDCIYINYWESNGIQTLVKGNGFYTHYNENGVRISQGECFENKKTGMWKTWDADGKLYQVGNYLNGKKDGIWWEGDLEGLNFVDDVCYIVKNEAVMKELEQLKKNIQITRIIYDNGKFIQTERFNMNMNKEKTRPFIDQKDYPYTP